MHKYALHKAMLHTCASVGYNSRAFNAQVRFAQGHAAYLRQCGEVIKLATETAKVGILAIAAYGLYEGIKWTAAAVLAPETGGASLILAGATP